MLMLLLFVEYQDVWLSDFSADTRLGKDLHDYARRYSQKVWSTSVLELMFTRRFYPYYLPCERDCIFASALLVCWVAVNITLKSHWQFSMTFRTGMQLQVWNSGWGTLLLQCAVVRFLDDLHANYMVDALAIWHCHLRYVFGLSVRLFVHSSEHILLTQYHMNGLNNLDESYRNIH